MGINETRMTVHEVAKLTGITNRTLHYYDEIGLLSPSIVTETKYRIYTNENLGRLQEILFFKKIGFSLKEAKTLLTSSFYSQEKALSNHLKILELKKKRIDRLINLVNDTLDGKSNCSFEAFSEHEILEAQAHFQKEVTEKWSATSEHKFFSHFFSEHTERERVDKWNDLIIQSQSLFERLVEYTSFSPTLPKVQELVQEWQEYISENFYPCSAEMLTYLGELYISEDRFSNYIDRFGVGASAFFQKAIQHYCTNNSDTHG